MHEQLHVFYMQIHTQVSFLQIQKFQRVFVYNNFSCLKMNANLNKTNTRLSFYYNKIKMAIFKPLTEKTAI